MGTPMTLATGDFKGQEVTLREQNERVDGSDVAMQHGVQCVGNIKFLFKHPLLDALSAYTKYEKLFGGVYLTGFKLESVVFNAEGMLENAKLIPLLNGDTMTLTNACKAGRMTIPATRTSAGLEGGDLVAVADFIRSEGDSNGGTLEVSWILNGRPRKITFKSVCVAKVDPLKLAGNDLPDMPVILTYATYEDNDFPKWT